MRQCRRIGPTGHTGWSTNGTTRAVSARRTWVIRPTVASYRSTPRCRYRSGRAPTTPCWWSWSTARPPWRWVSWTGYTTKGRCCNAGAPNTGWGRPHRPPFSRGGGGWRVQPPVHQGREVLAGVPVEPRHERASILVAVPVMLYPVVHHREERRVAELVADRVQHQRRSKVDVVGCEVAGGELASGACLGPRPRVTHPPAVQHGLLRDPHLVDLVEHLDVRGEPLVEPHVAPGARGDRVAEPVV